MRRLLFAGSLLVTAVVSLSLGPSDEEILIDKLWVDRLPVKPRSFTQLLFFNHRGWGVMGRASLYREQIDWIEFDHRGPFKVRILQDDSIEEWKVRAWRCQPGEAPDPDFDYCMSVERNGAVTKYFAWEEDEDDALERLQRMAFHPISIR